MALGGGNFLTQDKILPGTYINFVSASGASNALSERGIAAIAMEMDWGPENSVFEAEQGDFSRNSLTVFGYPYTDDKMKPIRELFLHAQKVLFFRLNPGETGNKAANTYATAQYTGTRGNALKVVVTTNENSTEGQPLYDVCTYLDTVLVDRQNGVAGMADLKANRFVTWESGASLGLTAGMPLTGGSNGAVTNAAHQNFLDQLESYSFNAVGCLSADETIKSLYAAYTARMRDELGRKFQCVVFRKLADHEGVISLKNGLRDNDITTDLIPWVTGVAAGTAVNKSASSLLYDGEYEPDTRYTQAQLEAGIREGSFMLHLVNGSVRVLTDINSFVSYSEEKGEDFSSNQTVRVLDQIANSEAALFAEKYQGKVPNDAAGRISLWNDIVKLRRQLQEVRAIEDFTSDSVTVEPGEDKRAVVVNGPITPVNAMEQLYMTVYIR